MKPIYNYIILVDNYRRPSRKRNTAGRYRVGAKTPKEARILVQKAIGFGSVQVYYQAPDNIVDYKEIVREIPDGDRFRYLSVRHANAPMPDAE